LILLVFVNSAGLGAARGRRWAVAYPLLELEKTAPTVWHPLRLARFFAPAILAIVAVLAIAVLI